MILQDSNDILWLIGVTNQGVLTKTVVGGGTPSSWFLNDALGNSWSITLVPEGDPGTTARFEQTPVSPSNYPTAIGLTSPGNIAFDVTILSVGRLYVYPVTFPPESETASIPLPFTKRTTSAVAVFPCIFIASATGAQVLAFGNVPQITALQLEYAALVEVYDQLIHQPTANNRAMLYAAIAEATITVSSLSTTLHGMTATGDAAIKLQGMQSVVANALTNLENAQLDETA